MTAAGTIPRRPAWRMRIEAVAAAALTPVVTLLTYLFLFAPIVVLIVYSFNASRSTVVWSGFTFDWYATLLADRDIGRALTVSLIVALASATVSTLVGTVTALALARPRVPGRNTISTLLLAPLVLPEIVISVAFLVFMVLLGIRLGYLTMIPGHVLITVPYTTLVVRAAVAALDRRLDEAAADLGATAWQTFRRVTVPLLMPAILTAFLLSATLSFDNFVMSTFTSGVGTTPLPLRIYSMLKLGITPEINALGALMVLVNVAVVVLVLGRSLGVLRQRR
jgi:spermidine/putrescine transport system permease protein